MKYNRIANRLLHESIDIEHKQLQKEGAAFLAPIISFIVRKFGMKILKWVAMQILKQLGKTIIKDFISSIWKDHSGDIITIGTIIGAVVAANKYEDLDSNVQALFDEAFNMLGGNDVIKSAIAENVPEKYQETVNSTVDSIIDYAKPMLFNKVLEAIKPELNEKLTALEQGQDINELG